MKRSHEAGFTMIEIVLTLALLAVIGGIGVPVYASFQNRNTLDLAASSFASGARRAQLQAKGMAEDSAWGVRAESGSIIVFKGSSYAVRDTAFDEIIKTPTSITLAGTQEFIFTKFTGLPLSTGSLTLTSASDQARTVSINAKGTVEY